ncbi:MAG: superinfection immunity protein [Cytophagales bacterium]|nr:superinfection immunity protein [Cytophagales bacterium]
MMTLLILLTLYFLPTLIARDKKGAAGIFLLNFFLGWTFIGYIFALLWALAADPKPAPAGADAALAGELIRLDHLQRSGALSWAEYERRKTRLLYGYA